MNVEEEEKDSEVYFSIEEEKKRIECLRCWKVEDWRRRGCEATCVSERRERFCINKDKDELYQQQLDVELIRIGGSLARRWCLVIDSKQKYVQEITIRWKCNLKTILIEIEDVLQK